MDLEKGVLTRGVRLREVKNVEFFKIEKLPGRQFGVLLWAVSVSGGSNVPHISKTFILVSLEGNVCLTSLSRRVTVARALDICEILLKNY